MELKVHILQLNRLIGSFFDLVRFLLSNKFLSLSIGGTIGTIGRYIVGVYSAKLFGVDFPYGTLIVNTIGSFILSFFMILSTEKLSIDPAWRFLIAIGFCGAFTTMSTFTYETFALFMEGMYLRVLLNILLNMSLPVTATFFGILCAKIIGEML